MVRIELDRVRRTFGRKAAVDDLSLVVESGELCVLLGPSGCGKSTTLRCIAGLERIDAGAIRFDGRVVDELDPVERDVAMVFQNYALYPHMTVAGNIAFPLRMARTDRATRERRVTEVAAALGLSDLLERRPRQLSGGQQQRVALARALVRDPKVFLFDEPLSNLDARLRVELRAEIRALHARLGTTMVYVTHDQGEAMGLADRIAVLHDGRLLQTGTPIEVYDRPATRFVAGFLGSPPMRFVRATADGGRLRALDVELAVDPRATGTADVGIRPHRLRVGGPGPRRITATVRAVELHGHETLLEVDAGGDVLLASADGHLRAAPGTAVELAFDPADLHVFDAAGARLDHRAP